MKYHIAPSRKHSSTFWNILFLILFLLAVCLVFWRCPYGFGNIDESFYLTIPYRLLHGDALFLEEWHLSQMAGILTLPLVSIFLQLNGSTEGIILAMRYVYTFIQSIFTIFFFIRLKGIHPLGAILASVSFLLYTPFGIMALSYNSMGILLLLLSLVIVITSHNYKQFQYCISGLLFAGAVLCCPYLLTVYILYLFVVAFSVFLRKRNFSFANDPILTINCAVFFTSGAVIAAILFAFFVLARGSLPDIIQSLNPIFNDPEHPALSLTYKTRIFLANIFSTNKWTPLLYIILILLAILCLWVRKHRQFVPSITCIIAIIMVGMQFSFFHENQYINHLMWSANVFAGFIVLLSTNKTIYKLFFSIWLPGIIYAYCLNLSSNQGFYAIASASSVATFASILIICMFAEELLHCAEERKVCKRSAIILTAVFLTAQFYTQSVMRYQLAFWDSTIEYLTAPITSGVNKGVYTTEDNCNLYYQKLDYLDQLSDFKGKNVLYLSLNTWYYLQNENQMATYSAWLSGVNQHTIDRLEIYYQINPHKLPDAVFADKEYADYADLFCQRFLYSLHTVNGGYLLLPD